MSSLPSQSFHSREVGMMMMVMNVFLYSKWNWNCYEENLLKDLLFKAYFLCISSFSWDIVSSKCIALQVSHAQRYFICIYSIKPFCTCLLLRIIREKREIDSLKRSQPRHFIRSPFRMLSYHHPPWSSLLLVVPYLLFWNLLCTHFKWAFMIISFTISTYTKSYLGRNACIALGLGGWDGTGYTHYIWGTRFLSANFFLKPAIYKPFSSFFWH